MKELKCPKCGKVFDKNLSSCPDCSHPASQCSVVVTTDTGYKYEDTITQLADGVWIIAMVTAIILAITTLAFFISSLTVNILLALLVLIGGILLTGSIWVFGLITKAFLYVYSNISINIHEINMKIK